MHDEVQSQAERAAARRCRAWSICTRISPTRRVQGFCRCCFRLSRCWPRSPGCGRVAATGRRGPRRNDGPAGGRGLLPRPRPAAHRRCSFPTPPTAPIRPAPRWPASRRSTVKSTPDGLVDLDDLARQARRRRRRVHDHQSEHAGAVRRDIAEIAEIVHDAAGWSISTGRT